MAGPRVLFLGGTGIDHEAAAAVARLLEPRATADLVIEQARDRIDARAHAQAMLSSVADGLPLLLPQPQTFAPPPRFVPGKRKRWRRSQRSGR